jgi:hypothetical protein
MIAGAAAGLGMLVGALPAAAQQEVNEGPKPFVSVWPSKVIAGNPLSVEGNCGDTSTPLVTSPGFAGSVKLGTGGKAVDKPGKYTATLKCRGNVLTTTFEVVKPGTPQPSQVTIKPKGAPQTGGGFLAG